MTYFYVLESLIALASFFEPWVDIKSSSRIERLLALLDGFVLVATLQLGQAGLVSIERGCLKTMWLQLGQSRETFVV